MAGSELPVIAAIPNYNMAASLAVLLPQVLGQGYDKIYVLDDLSTDDSHEVVARFAPQVVWIAGDANIGSGGNRNRVLGAHTGECIIHFFDADVLLKTKSTAAQARLMLGEPNTGFVGGLVIEKGTQSIWNFGPSICSLHSVLVSLVQYVVGRRQARRPVWRRLLRSTTRRFLVDVPDLARPPRRRPVFWVHEANMVIKRSTLEKLGGFDANIREHDIQPIARQAFDEGLVSYFDPRITVEHTLIQVRGYNRQLRRQKTSSYLRRKYGLKQWLMPDGHFRPRHNMPPQAEAETAI